MKYIILSTFLFFSPNLAHASEPLNVQYSIYASGFEVVNIDATYTVTDKTYAAEMDLKTIGMLGRLAPWSGVLKSNGLNHDQNPTPLSHSFANTWRDETKITAMDFDNEGVLTTLTKTNADGSVEDIMPNEDVSKNTIDIMTAIYRASQGGTCDGTQTAMDGKRKFDMVFKSHSREKLTPGKYNKFDGDAEICTIEIQPISGKWREKKRGWMSIQEQAKNDGTLPKIWFGNVGEQAMNIPVRLQIQTNYGAMIMHLTGVE
jgi:hypothetical protein